MSAAVTTAFRSQVTSKRMALRWTFAHASQAVQGTSTAGSSGPFLMLAGITRWEERPAILSPVPYARDRPRSEAGSAWKAVRERQFHQNGR